MKNLKELKTFEKVALIILALTVSGLASMSYFAWVFELNIKVWDIHMAVSVTISSIVSVLIAGYVFLESFTD